MDSRRVLSRKHTALPSQYLSSMPPNDTIRVLAGGECFFVDDEVEGDTALDVDGLRVSRRGCQ
jgi:hypothetical protein